MSRIAASVRYRTVVPQGSRVIRQRRYPPLALASSSPQVACGRFRSAAPLRSFATPGDPRRLVMRTAMRRVAFVGDIHLEVTEALRAQGCRVEQIDGNSVVTVARDLMRLRPAVVHA